MRLSALFAGLTKGRVLRTLKIPGLLCRRSGVFLQAKVFQMRITEWFRTLGPGLLYAGAAVGVSHLVQTTRAGADFGFDLVWIIILANVVKYPFFEFGPRYATASGKDLVSGYAGLGRWAIILFGLLTITTMFVIQAAVTTVTASLFAHVFHLQISSVLLYSLVIGITMLVLMIGRYTALDKAMKFVIILLTLATILAVIYALKGGYHPDPEHAMSFDIGNPANIFFLIALIGWMPAPIDLSVWHSIWSVAKRRAYHKPLTMGQSLTDFRIGYIGTTLLAVCFLILGALVMHGSGESFSPKGPIFASQLIGMYTATMGSWTYWIISIAALTTMISTTLTTLDAYPRVILSLGNQFMPKIPKQVSATALYRINIVVVAAGSVILVALLSGTMRFMVDLATTLSFVTAPLLAYLNYKVVTNHQMPKSDMPPTWLRIYAIAGILLLSGFTLFYVFWNFFH